MSFRQDRTNPSSAVSNWKGRSETPKGWPSTRVSTWMNGGLFGAGGPADAITWIAGVNGTGSSATLEFTGIPQTYNILRFVLSTAQTDPTGAWCQWVINGDTSSEYRRGENFNSGSSVYNTINQANEGVFPISPIPGSTENVGSMIMEWPGYTQTSGNQQSWGQSQFMLNDTSNIASVGGIAYSPTSLAAITSMAVKSNSSSYHWETTTRLDMYGIGSNA